MVKEELALLLPFFGTLLVTPPLINLFVRPVDLFGIPLVTVYLFIIWLLIVLAAVVLSRLSLVREGSGSSQAHGVAGQNDNSDAQKPPGIG